MADIKGQIRAGESASFNPNTTIGKTKEQWVAGRTNWKGHPQREVVLGDIYDKCVAALGNSAPTIATPKKVSAKKAAAKTETVEAAPETPVETPETQTEDKGEGAE